MLALRLELPLSKVISRSEAIHAKKIANFAKLLFEEGAMTQGLMPEVPKGVVASTTVNE